MASKNYRQILKENEQKSKLIIGSFLFLYIFIGLLGDILFGLVHNKIKGFSYAIYSLITFNQIPYFSLSMLMVGLISLLVVLKAHDKMMLWGSEYKEINLSMTNLSAIEKQVINIVEELKIAAGLKYLPKIYYVDAHYMNAFSSGYSEKSAMVAITSGLLDKLNRTEIQAVLAHEISHIKHMDIKLTLLVGLLSNIMFLVIDWLFNFLRIFGGRKDDSGGNTKAIASIFIILLRVFLPIVTTLLTFYLNRTREYMADAGAIKLTRDNHALASALLKIQENYNSNEHIDEGITVRKSAYIYNPLKDSVSNFFSTHPSIELRINALGFKNKKEI